MLNFLLLALVEPKSISSFVVSTDRWDNNSSIAARWFTNPELSQIPDNIIKCYTDRNLWDRFNRLPYNVDSLIAIIRKIELHPEVKELWVLSVTLLSICPHLQIPFRVMAHFF